MQNHIAVSIIINCFNGEKYLRPTMDSVFAQTFQDWEIIFWDNASTDNSAQIAKSYGDRVRYFRSAVNTPLGAARNSALREAHGEFVAILDCDDIWLPSKLAEQVNYMIKNESVGLSYTDTGFLINDRETGALFSSIYPPHSGNVLETLLIKRDFVVCSSILFRGRLIEQIGFFDESYQSAEEYEFLVKAACVTEFGYINKALVLLRRHDQSFSSLHKDVTAREVIETIVKYSPNDANLLLKIKIKFRLLQLYAKLFLLKFYDF